MFCYSKLLLHMMFTELVSTDHQFEQGHAAAAGLTPPDSGDRSNGELGPKVWIRRTSKTPVHSAAKYGVFVISSDSWLTHRRSVASPKTVKLLGEAV